MRALFLSWTVVAIACSSNASTTAPERGHGDAGHADATHTGKDANDAAEHDAHGNACARASAACDEATPCCAGLSCVSGACAYALPSGCVDPAIQLDCNPLTGTGCPSGGVCTVEEMEVECESGGCGLGPACSSGESCVPADGCVYLCCQESDCPAGTTCFFSLFGVGGLGECEPSVDAGSDAANEMCGTENGAACEVCCEEVQSSGYATYLQLLATCVCVSPGTCATDCAGQICEDVMLPPSAECSTCEGQECTSRAAQMCAADSGCVPWQTCRAGCAG